MSIRAVVDVTINLSVFRNIYIKQQAFFCMSFKVYYLRKDRKIYGKPFKWDKIPSNKRRRIYMSDPDREDLSKIRSAEISYSSNFYKTKVFCIQRTDQEMELNEAFGFRVEVELSPTELLKYHKDNDTSSGGIYNYESMPFFVEVELYSQKCKFWDLSYKDVMHEFYNGHMKKAQIITLALK